MTTTSATLNGARINALLREASSAFDGPVALLTPAATETARAAYASAAVTSAKGERLATLCILGAPKGPIPPATAARLRELADRCAAAIDDEG